MELDCKNAAKTRRNASGMSNEHKLIVQKGSVVHVYNRRLWYYISVLHKNTPVGAHARNTLTRGMPLTVVIVECTIP